MAANYCSEDYLDIVNAVRATAFTISFLACLLVFVIWIIFACGNCNREKFCDPSLFYTAERLPFYVLIIATIHSFISVFQLASLGHDKSNSVMKFCTAVAFFTTWLDTSMLFISIIAPLHLMLINCKKCSNWLQDLKRRRPLALEVGYILTVTVGSLIVALIPLFCLFSGVSCYGYDPKGQWCWIRGRDENCVKITAGLVMQILLFYLPTFIALLLILAVVCHILIIKCKKRCPPFILRLVPDQEDQEEFTCPMIALTVCLLLFSIINVISFGIRLSQIPRKADAIVLSIDHSLWGFIPSIAIFILLLFERREARKNTDEMTATYDSISMS